MSELLMKLQSSMLLAVDVHPSVLYIYNDKLVFHGNVGVLGNQEVVLNYDQVAQVNHHKGVIEGSLEIINSGGTNSITIDHITNEGGDKAKGIIDQRASLSHSESNLPPPPPPPSVSTNNPTGVELLDGLAKLRDQGVLTEDEFEEKKKQILNRI